MDKRFRELLKRIEFGDAYIQLYEKNRENSGSTKLSVNEKQLILDKIDGNLHFEYFEKEGFFQSKEQVGALICVLNIAISESRIEFILFFQNDSIKLKEGGPFGLLAKRLNPKVPNYYKIPYNNERGLSLSLKKGIHLYKEVREKVLFIES